MKLHGCHCLNLHHCKLRYLPVNEMDVYACIVKCEKKGLFKGFFGSLWCLEPFLFLVLGSIDGFYLIERSEKKLRFIFLK